MARVPAKPPSKELIVAATVAGARERYLKQGRAGDWLATFDPREAHDFGDADAAQQAIDEYQAKGGDRFVRVEPGQWRAYRMTVSFAPA